MKTYKSPVDYGEALNKLSGMISFTHRGSTVKKSGGKLWIGEKSFDSLEDIDDYLDDFYGSWEEKIVSQNKQPK